MLNRLFKSRKRMHGTIVSAFLSTKKGHGVEMVDTRPYAQGDEQKSVNRKLSAKYEQLITNLFQRETNGELHIFFDCNTNRNGGKTRSYRSTIKSEFLRREQQLRHYQIKPIGRVRTGKWFTQYAADKTGSVYHQRLETCESLLKKTTSNYISHCKKFLQEQSKLSKLHSIIIVSDFLQCDETDKKLLNHLRKTHELLTIQLTVPRQEGKNFHRLFVQDKPIAIKSDITLYPL